LDTINENVKNARYAVRGPIVMRALELQRKLADPSFSLPFTNIVSCNIGNPQALGQQPLSFIRDILSIVVNPSIVSRATFPNDVLLRAKSYLNSIPSVGAYSESQGLLSVRDEVAKFLERRDGYASSTDDIFLTNGASEGVRFCMNTILRDPSSGFRDGILTPVPQYPLYSAMTTLLNGVFIPYYLDESQGWAMSIDSVRSAIAEARADGVCIRAMVVINPGNPTGNVFTRSNLKEIISLCQKENICLMADEVYQSNLWNPDADFISCRKIGFEMNAFDGPEPLQLISFHSISKGFLGECGLRGGFFEVLGFPDAVKGELLKLASIALCSNVIGQIATGVMVHPPEEGGESYETYVSERDGILASLRRRAKLVATAFNEIPGMSCTYIDGALYAFPSIQLSEKAVEDAKSNGVEPDAWYCMELLEHTGIVLVPGSGFGQVPGTFHFRSTILPPEDKIDTVISSLRSFHASFSARYS